MRMQVLGEGVETPAQLAALGRLGCDLAQGFLLAPPMPAAEAATLLRRGRLPLAGG
jgi:EAL domain-containing protein (putative c-di-GMP-specific phosphodiesterase class I)